MGMRGSAQGTKIKDFTVFLDDPILLQRRELREPRLPAKRKGASPRNARKKKQHDRRKERKRKNHHQSRRWKGPCPMKPGQENRPKKKAKGKQSKGRGKAFPSKKAVFAKTRPRHKKETLPTRHPQMEGETCSPRTPDWGPIGGGKSKGRGGETAQKIPKLR